LNRVLPQQFFNRPTLLVAQELLGKFLVCKKGSNIVSAMITEVEAYVGVEDKASHASRARTKRNEVMFGHAGYWYVYLIYGMHYCLNIVTEQKDYPAAILIRGVENV
jgi:DNA-3-methyladenine glycosylase